MNYSQSVHNTKEGIEGFLIIYPNLFELIKIRKEAHDTGKKLDSFVLFGSLILDTFGDVEKFIPAPKDTLKDLPTVELEGVFRELIKSMGFDDACMSVGREPLYLPPPLIACAECHEYFGFDDCHNVLPEITEYRRLNLNAYIGITLWEYIYSLNQNPSVHSVVDPDLTIRNARFVNNLHHPYALEHDEVINESGWVGDSEGLPLGYIIQDGDQTCLTETRYFHPQCFWKHVAEKSYNHFNSILEQVGFVEFKLACVGDASTTSGENNLQYRVDTPYGVFTINYDGELIRIIFSEWAKEVSSLFVDMLELDGVNVLDQQEVIVDSPENTVIFLKTMISGIVVDI